MDPAPEGAGLSDAPPRASDPRLLTPHRIASRALVGAPVGGALATAWAFGALWAGGAFPRGHVPVLAAFLCLVGVAAILAFLLVVEQLALRVHAALRPPFVLISGAGGGLLIAGAVVWVQALLDGQGTSGAWEALAGIRGWVERNPDRSVVIAVDPLVAFLVVGTLRTLPRAIHPLIQLPAAGLAGVLAVVLHGALWRPIPDDALVTVVAIFAGVPAACVVGLWLAERLESRLAGAFERWRERD